MGACGGGDDTTASPDDAAPLPGDAGAPDATTDDGAADAAGPEVAPNDAAEAGPSCVDPSKLLPVGAMDVTASCLGPSTCGGALDGTWIVDTACEDPQKLLAAKYAFCKAIAPDGATATAQGFVVFDGGRVSRHLVVDGTVRFHTTDSSCGYGNSGSVSCAALMGPGCTSSPPGCACTEPVHQVIDDEATYGLSGSTYTEDGGTFTFCADGKTLTIADPTFGQIHLKSSPILPEVCDGLDEDGNGVVDDAPKDCLPCSNKGVCAAGDAPKCAGKSGWDCHYVSPDYEPVETKCDGLDNDCNGVADEPLKCHETCDGIDNDGDGTIDNHLDPPTCLTVGACAGSGAPVCSGAQGWKCTYPSADYEPVETKCDGIDNDCNGQIDEACATCPNGTAPGSVFYSIFDNARDRVESVGLDGAGPKELFAIPGVGVTGLGFDGAAKKMYWLEHGALRRANLDGAAAETLAAVGNAPFELALDVAGRYAYWTDDGAAALWRITIAPYASPQKLASIDHDWVSLDLSARKVYWSGSAGLMRSDLDGANPELVYNVAGQALWAAAVDPRRGKIYAIWGTVLESANLDGSGRQYITSPPYAYGSGRMRVDPAGQYVYFVNGVSQVHRVSLAGAPDAGVSASLADSVYAADVARCVAP